MKPSNNRTYVIYRVGSIGGSKIRNRKPSTLLGAAKHNLREIHLELGPGSCIDSSKSNQNLVLVGSNFAQGIVTQMRNRMLEAGVEWHPKLSHFEENLHPNLSHPNRLSCLIFEQGWARSDQRGNFEQITQTCPSRQGLHPAS
jgi:hypothetical protein